MERRRPALPDSAGRFIGIGHAARFVEVTGRSAEMSTTGGTSDGRFISTFCPQVIEFGPPNATIHKIDEHIALSDLEPLKNVYRRTLELLIR